jgi:hypothetical protein
MSRNVFQIESGRLGLAIVQHGAVGYSTAWQAPGGKTLANVTLADYNAFSTTWSCQIIDGALNATPDTTTTDVPATWCEAGETIPTPGKTAYEFGGSFIQDINVKDGLNRFLFEYDTAEAYIYASFNADAPPRFIGRTRITSGTMGGAARENLTSDFSLALTGKPDVEFGISGNSSIVTGAGSEQAVARADANPGDIFPADTDITAQDATNAAKLAGEGFVANPQTAWTTGQKITVGTYQFNWSGTAWAAGPHA